MATSAWFKVGCCICRAISTSTPIRTTHALQRRGADAGFRNGTGQEHDRVVARAPEAGFHLGGPGRYPGMAAIDTIRTSHATRFRGISRVEDPSGGADAVACALSVRRPPFWAVAAGRAAACWRYSPGGATEARTHTLKRVHPGGACPRAVGCIKRVLIAKESGSAKLAAPELLGTSHVRETPRRTFFAPFGAPGSDSRVVPAFWAVGTVRDSPRAHCSCCHTRPVAASGAVSRFTDRHARFVLVGSGWANFATQNGVAVAALTVPASRARVASRSVVARKSAW